MALKARIRFLVACPHTSFTGVLLTDCWTLDWSTNIWCLSNTGQSLCICVKPLNHGVRTLSDIHSPNATLRKLYYNNADMYGTGYNRATPIPRKRTATPDKASRAVSAPTLSLVGCIANSCSSLSAIFSFVNCSLTLR